MFDQRPILCLAGWWPEEGSVAGIFIREHILAIQSHRPVEVVFASVEKGHQPWPTIRLNTYLDNGLTMHRITIRTPIRRAGFPTILLRRAYRMLLMRIKRPALIHIHVRTNETSVFTSLARARNIPVVVTEHNSFYHLGIRDLPPTKQAAERDVIRKWFNDPNITSVMPVSEDLARVLVDDYDVRRELIKVIPNVAAPVFRPGPPPTAEPFRILLAALWRPPKDHDVFIRALLELPANLRQACVVEWAGYGPDMDLIKKRCAIELSDVDVRFPGLLSKTALAHAMRQAHLFVLPTLADNLPCVVLESLCCGTPVVSMSVNGVPELINESNGILVPPSSPNALAQALARCMGNDSLFDRAAIARAALTRYAPNAVGERIVQVYTKVLGQPPRNG